MSVTTPQNSSLARGLVSVYGDVLSPPNLKSSLHMGLNLPIGVFSFTVIIALLSVTAGLLIVFPIALVTGWLLWATSTGLAAMERGRFRGLLRTEINAPLPTPTDGGVLAGARKWITSGTTWRTILYHLLLMPIGILSFTITIVVWSVPVWLVVVGAVGAVVPFAGVATNWLLAVTFVLLGVALIAFIPYPIRAMAVVNRTIGRALLGPSSTDVLEERVTRLTTSRDHLAESAEGERRRIERDLHDGAQQRLVSLGMSLGLAKEKLDSDMEGAKELVEEAHFETKRALGELRDLARGIHPAILSEKGLEAALAPLAAVSPVPVTLNVDVEERPESRVETVAYFVVSEALANVAKHSAATSASVTIVRQDDQLVIEVADDGRGGADSSGGGLSGLRHRVEGIDGWFTVTSPAGGPTSVMAQLPCS